MFTNQELVVESKEDVVDVSFRLTNLSLQHVSLRRGVYFRSLRRGVYPVSGA